MQLPSKNYANNFFTFIVFFICFTSYTIAQINWQQTNGPYGGIVSSFAVSGTNLFAGSTVGGVFLSTNNGANWTAVNSGLTNTNVYSLAVSDTKLFAGTWNGGVFLSTNNGTSWISASVGLTNAALALAVSGTNLFAGTSTGVFLSTNNGSSWIAINFGLTNTDVKALAVSGENLFAGTAGGVFLSTNNGANWTAVNTNLTNMNVLNLSASGTNLFAGTNGGGVFLSTNNGSSWTAVNDGLTNTFVNTIAVSGANLFAGTYDGVFLSNNNGTNWTEVNAGLTSPYIYALAVSGTNLFAGSGGGVFLSTNSGTSWTDVNTGLTNTDVLAFAVSGTNLFAGTNGGGGGGVFLSTNNGTNWTVVNVGLTNTSVTSLAVSETNLFAGTNTSGVFRSTNNGASWSAVNAGLSNTNVKALAVSGANLFAGIWGAVFLSTNNGTSWSKTSNDLPNIYISALVVSGTHLFAGTWGGIYLSNNNGTSWSAVSAGLTVSTISALVVSGTNIFAGTNGGVFLSTNDGTSWTEVNAGLTNTVVNALTVSGANLFAGTDDGVFLSTNNGTSWSKTSTGLTSIKVRTLTVSGVHLFAGTEGGGVFISTIPTTLPPPTIVSFSPPSGPINTTVTITGTNFSTIVSNNIVYFGAVKATVTAATSTSLSVIVPSGATYQPITVTNMTTGLTAFSSKPFTVTFPSSQIIDAASFESKVDFITGSYPNGIAMSDIDGDGKPDLVVTNYDNSVSVFRNTSAFGSITTSSFAPKVDFTTRSSPWNVVIGDVDGDGRPDVVFTNPISNTVSVFRNTSASGSINASSFASELDFTTGLDPLSVAIGDVDGDGKPDLVIANNGSNTVSVLRNTGASGSITGNSFAPKVDFMTTSFPTGVAMGDVDGDGKPDLVITNNGSNTVSVLRNTSTSGSITVNSFVPKVDFTTGSAPTCVAVGDVDGDGKPDLVVSNERDNTVSVFRNTCASGSITINSFAPKIDFTMISEPHSVSLGDVDGDGKPDLVVSDLLSNTVSVLRNTSISGFLTSSSFAPKVDFTTGWVSWGVAIGDVDGDGKSDLITANYNDNSISVLRNMIGGSSPHPTITSFTPTRNMLNVAKYTNITVTFNTDINQSTLNNSTIKINGSLSGLHPATFSYNSSSKTVTITPNNLFKDGEIVTVTLTCGIKNIAGDLLANSNSWLFAVKTNAATGKFTLASSLNVGLAPFSVTSGDWNNDGFQDLAVANGNSNTVSIMINNRNGQFTQTSSPSGGGNPRSITSGDWNGDGYQDLAVANSDSNTVSILINNGNGQFTLTSTPSVGGTPCSITSGDWNGDGYLDLAAASSSSHTVSILINNGNGQFTLISTLRVGYNPSSITAGDWNSDGYLDLAVVNMADDNVSILINNGNGQFTQTSTPTVGRNPWSVTAGDWNGDGYLDLAVTNFTSNTVSILINNGSGTFTQTSALSVGISPYSIISGDWNGDGYQDLAVTNSYGNTVSILINNNGNGQFMQESLTGMGGFPSSFALGDWKGEGYLDLAVTNTNSNTISILMNRAISDTTHSTITSFTPMRNALHVVQSTGITVTFDTIMNAKSFTDSTIRINGSLSGLHPATFSYNSSTKTATITPNTPFKVGELVTVTLTSRIKSLYGDSLTNGFSWSFTVKTNACSGFFYQSSTAGVGNTPWYLAAADFNGDSAMDLAVVNNYSNDVSILTNNGKGIFTKTSAINVGNYPGSITAADLDGDGDMDLAVTNSQSNTVSILKNDGHGTFTQTSVVSVAANPWNVAAADLDGDGAIDLAIAGYSGTVSILKNDGNGSFTLTSTITVGSHAYSVTAADLNGDGAIDLAVTDYGSNTVAILTNNGSGAFKLASTINVGKGSAAAAAADLDGDGAIDLAVVNFYSNTISILKNNGSGTFTLTSTINTENYPTSVIAMDAEGNGIMDLAVVNAGSGSVSIMKNNGSGSFTLASTVSTDIGSSPRIVTAADFDGDGRIDLASVILNFNSVSIIKNSVSRATIGISSSLLSFGSVPVGSNKSEYLKIYNYGTDSSLVVSNITSSNTSFIVNRTALSIAASGCDSILVTFLPTTKNTLFNDSLIFTSNDAENPFAKIALTGSSSTSQLKALFILNLGGPIYAGISVLGDNAMYAIASGDAVYRMNTAGSVAYKLEVAGDIRSSSSISYDTTVYIASSDRNLYAFSKDGNSVWSLPTGGVLTATPVVDSITNRLYIGVSNHNFIAVNRSTGKVDWNYFADDQIRNSAVVTSDRKLIFASQKGTLYGFDLNNLTLPAAPSWQIALPDTAPSSIALDNQGYIYIGTSAGYLLKISMPVNQQPLIVWQILVGQAIVGSPVIDATGTVYAGSLDANLYAVDIQSGSVKWTFSTKGAIRSTPAISNAGTIFVANDSGEVISLDVNKNILWYYKTSNSIVAPLLYYQSTLYAGTLGNQIIALYDAADSSLLHKSGSSQQKTGKPVWATFQGNNQRTGMYSLSGTNDGTTGLINSGSRLPVDYTLMQNYPNPFNPLTTIQFALPKEGRVSIKVFNILGKYIATLLDGFQNAGYHEVTFDWDSFSSGIYFYQMRVGSFIETKKMMLMK